MIAILWGVFRVTRDRRAVLFRTALILCLACLIVACNQYPAELAIMVRDAETGQPVPNAYVTLEGSSVDAKMIQEGLVCRLPIGQLWLTVGAPGYQEATVSCTTSQKALRQDRTVDLQPRELVGRVTDGATGASIGGAKIGGPAASATTDATGLWRLAAVTVPDLRISAGGYLSTTVPADALEALFDKTGALAAPRETVLEPCYLKGLVRDVESGDPIAHATVEAGHLIAETDAYGRFWISCLQPGIDLTISHPHYRGASVPYTGQVEQELLLDPWRLELTIVDGVSQLPIPGAMIRSGSEEWTANGSGLASIRLRLGSELTVSAEGYYHQAVMFDGQNRATVVLQPSRLLVTITDAQTSVPITSAHVLAYQVQGARPFKMTTDDDGVLTLEDVEQYGELIVKVPGYRSLQVSIGSAGLMDLQLQPFQARGIYVPFGLLTRPRRMNALLDMVEQSDELNTIVVDVKSDRAYLAWQSDHPIALATEGYISDVMPLDELLADCRRRGIYTIARIVVFKDDLLAEVHPEWAVRREDGSFYVDLEGLRWVDPFRQEVRDYNAALAGEVAEMRFDEVQLDYLRFPSDGSTKHNVYLYESTFESRTQAMAEFCAQVHESVSLTPAFLSADVFGLTVWVDSARDMGIGQRLDDIAPYVDYLSPMLYPSTFGEGNLGFDYPVLYPYEVVYHSVLKTGKRTTTMVRPWLQHYSLSVDYGVQELLRQKKGAEDAGSAGWLFWNAAGKYDLTVFSRDAYSLLDPMPHPPEPSQ